MSLEMKIGALVFAGLMVIAGMSLHVSDSPLLRKSANDYYAYIDDATGLIQNSHVKTAGLSVGYVKEIVLEKGMAKLVLKIQSDLPIHTDAKLSLKSMGILGDRYLDLNPGSSNNPILADDSEIKNSSRDHSMDELMAGAAATMNEVKEILAAVKSAIAKDGTRDTSLGRIIDNLDRMTESLASTLENNEESLDKILKNLAEVSRGLQQNFANSDAQSQTVINRLNNTVGHLEEIMDKVKKGEGSIGKLVSNDETVDRLNSALSGIQKFVNKADRLQTIVDVNSSYLVDRNDTRSSFGLDIFTSPDKSYELALVSTPEGPISRRIESESDNGGATTTRDISVEEKNKLKFNAMFAKRWYDLVFKVGILESEGGLGMDYFLFHDNMKLSAAAFDFGGNKPNVRLETKLKFLRYFYAQSGGDSLLETNKRDLYLGAGVSFNDEDIKSVLGFMSLTN